MNAIDYNKIEPITLVLKTICELADPWLGHWSSGNSICRMNEVESTENNFLNKKSSQVKLSHYVTIDVMYMSGLFCTKLYFDSLRRAKEMVGIH